MTSNEICFEMKKYQAFNKIQNSSREKKIAKSYIPKYDNCMAVLSPKYNF